MLKLITLAGAATIAFSTLSFAQTSATMMPMTCDNTNMENLKADVKKAPSDAQKSDAQAAIGTATMAMQSGDIEGCVAGPDGDRPSVNPDRPVEPAAPVAGFVLPAARWL